MIFTNIMVKKYNNLRYRVLNHDILSFEMNDAMILHKCWIFKVLARDLLASSTTLAHGSRNLCHKILPRDTCLCCHDNCGTWFTMGFKFRYPAKIFWSIFFLKNNVFYVLRKIIVFLKKFAPYSLVNISRDSVQEILNIIFTSAQQWQ